MTTAEEMDLLDVWRLQSRRANVAHLRATDIFTTRYFRMGALATILAAVVSSSVFASVGESVSSQAKLAAAVIGLLAAAMAGINTFLRYGERIESHRRAARQYGNVIREIDKFRDCPPTDTCAAIEVLRLKLDEIDNDAPNVPGYVWVWAVEAVAWAHGQEQRDPSAYKRGLLDRVMRRGGQ
jgi:hypothetical protein